MNERIKQLWDDAALMTGDESKTWDGQVAFMALFAELIVKECAEVARAHTLEKYHGLISEYNGIVYVEEAIKQHFGVE